MNCPNYLAEPGSTGNRTIEIRYIYFCLKCRSYHEGSQDCPNDKTIDSEKKKG